MNVKLLNLKQNNMKKEDVKIGMEIQIKGFYDQSFPIIDINKDKVAIKGRFSEKIQLPQIIYVPISELIEGNFEGKQFTLKDCPKYNEKILVSDDGDAWFIRSFDSFHDKIIGGVYTILQCDDKKMQYDSNGESIGHIVEWNEYMRFNIIK